MFKWFVLLVLVIALEYRVWLDTGSLALVTLTALIVFGLHILATTLDAVVSMLEGGRSVKLSPEEAEKLMKKLENEE